MSLLGSINHVSIAITDLDGAMCVHMPVVERRTRELGHMA